VDLTNQYLSTEGSSLGRHVEKMEVTGTNRLVLTLNPFNKPERFIKTYLVINPASGLKDESSIGNVVNSFNSGRQVVSLSDVKVCNFISSGNSPNTSPENAPNFTNVSYTIGIPWSPADTNDGCLYERSTGSVTFEVKTEYRIFDLGGHLVKRINFAQEIVKYKIDAFSKEAGQTSGSTIDKIGKIWDFKNEKGRLVSAGGYLIYGTVTVFDMCDQVVMKETPPIIKHVVPSFRTPF